MILNTMWSWIFLTTSLHFADDIVLSQDVREVKGCPRECDCLSSNMMIYCGHEEGFNQLTEFPSFIPLKVKTLSLFNNRLKSIPEGALRNLTHLTNLNLGSNQLRHVPGTAFRDLVSLRSVNARLNKLSTLPRHLFRGLIRLQEVLLDDNEIVSIPDTLFQNLPSLRRLYLQRNKLKSFPETGFRGTLALQGFSLANNALKHISEGTFANLTSLSHLSLSHNKISNIPGKVFHGLRSLNKLELDNNEISFLPEMVFSGLKRGIDVSLSGNPFHCNCELRWLKTWLASRITSRFRTTCFRPSHLKGKPIANVANEQFTCVEGVWGDWSPWNACSSSCGRGTQISVRRCLSGRGRESCQGTDIRHKRCNNSECGASWTSWSQWSLCSKTCALGKEVRTRSCRHSKSGNGSCTGVSLENRACDQGPCIIDGLWGSWSKWSPCSVTCSWGTRVRERSCDRPKPQNGGRLCSGRKHSSDYCSLGSCPVNGGWSIWATWSSCTASCFNGTKMRRRKCNNPPPQYGGNWCDGVSTQVERCNKEPCPLDGSWSVWSRWGECSVTCSKGTQVRSRTCSHPVPQYGGKNCSGNSSDIKYCNIRSCPLDGIWAPWSQWTSCSKTCSNGTRTRNRTCSNPLPQYGGKICSGNSSDINYCNLRSCPLDGIWAPWSQWTSCSKTCSNGTRTRNRTCSNPLPQYGGKNCSGNSSDINYCNLRSCPLDGIWAPWSQWTSCSKTCSNGTRTRNRTCSNPPPRFGGKNCSGETSEIEACHRGLCPINGQWTAWSGWSNCSHTCSGGIKYRERTCNNPPPSNEGKNCTGNSTQVEMCNLRPCVVIKAWTEWSTWSDCSQTCSNATASRFRNCTAIPASQSQGGGGCLGDDVEIRYCHLQPCPLHGDWSEWSPWTPCSTKCSNKTRERSRHCISSGTAENNPNCKGHAREEESCEVDDNCILSAWSNWSECNNTCGNGTRVRHRTCQNVVSPSGNGPKCTENKIETISCGNSACPTGWSSWTACSTTCDFGEQTRTRSCGGESSNSSKLCPESDIEMRACSEGPCTKGKGLNEWSRWTQCSASCGYGKQVRYRNCSENGDAAFCKGAPMQITSCFLQECLVNGGWSNWSNWTVCSASCDKGVQARFRSCNNPRSERGGNGCPGKNVLYKECRIAECEDQDHNNSFWSSWTQWSKCSATCYRGYQTRSRYCRKQSSAFRLGNCTNSDGPIHVENRICEVKACTFSAWTRWSTWEACSQTCGNGIRKRVRYCLSLAVAVNCTGENLQTENCNTQLCPSVPTATYPPKITLGVPNPCPDPEKPVNGGYRIIDQDGSYYVQHYCKEHFFVHGPRLRHCEGDNSWSDYVAYCLPVCGESTFTSDDEQHRRLRIYGGATSLKGLWPWQVVLEVNNEFHCGGSLIAQSWVVTAAHCVYDRGTKIPYPYIRVYLGVHDITSRHTDPHVQRIDSAEIVPHPNFNWKTFDSDIALIKLAWKANITDYIRPVCLPNKRQRRKTIPGTVGVMLGWGKTEVSSVATKLREVYMPVVGRSNCQKAYKRQTWLVTSNMLCAGYKDNAKDSCRQDSGGGFLFPYSSGRTKKWFLGGIISWGNPQCGTPGKYSVFTQINSKFAKWIKNHVYI